MKQKANRFNPLYWYLAQIALEVRRCLDPKTDLSIQNFLLDFVTKQEEKPLTEDEKELHISYSKAKWFGITNTKNVIVRKPPLKNAPKKVGPLPAGLQEIQNVDSNGTRNTGRQARRGQKSVRADDAAIGPGDS